MLTRFLPCLTNRIILTMALLLLPSVAPAFAGQKPSLKESVIVVGDIVHVSDLVSGAPLNKASLAILHAPKPGFRAFIPVSDILAFLKPAALPDLDTKALQFVSLTRDSRRISPESIETLLSQEIIKRLPLKEGGRLKLSFSQPLNALHTEKTSQAPLQISKLELNQRGDFSATLAIPDSQYFSKSPLKLGGRAEAVTDVIALLGAGSRNDILTRADLTSIEIPLYQINDSHIVSAKDIEGLQLTQNVRAGQALTTTMIRRPKIIARNDSLDLHYSSGFLSIKTRVKALEDGSLNQVIKVLNPSSGKTIEAKVIGSNLVVPSGLNQVGGASQSSVSSALSSPSQSPNFFTSY